MTYLEVVGSLDERSCHRLKGQGPLPTFTRSTGTLNPANFLVMGGSKLEKSLPALRRKRRGSGVGLGRRPTLDGFDLENAHAAIEQGQVVVADRGHVA
jgi:hypothetical protein